MVLVDSCGWFGCCSEWLWVFVRFFLVLVDFYGWYDKCGAW